MTECADPCLYPRDVPAEVEHCVCGLDFQVGETRCYSCERLLCRECCQRECDECRDVHCSTCLFVVTRLGKARRWCQACIEREPPEI